MIDLGLVQSSFSSYISTVRMREMKTTNKENQSRVYKVTFLNGDTHYGRVVLTKNYSATTYLNDMAGRLKNNLNNPLRVNMTTEVEKRVAEEFATTKCEIVFEGLTSEAIKVKDELSNTDVNSLNLRTNVEVGESNKETIKVPIKYSKVVKSTKGDVINYISSTYAKLHKLGKYINETQRHPIDNSFTQILVPIQRY